MPDFSWKQGDTGPPFRYLLQNPDGSIPAVQGATVTVRFRSLTNASVTPTTGTAVVDTQGNATFTPSAADTSQPIGNYLLEWVLTNGSQVQTFPIDGYLWGRIEPSAVSAPALIISLEDAKQHLPSIPLSDKSRDFRILGLIQAITPLIEAQTGPIVPKIYEEWFDGGTNLHDVIRQPSSGFGTSPVFNVLAVSEFRGPIEYPLALVPSPAFGSIYSVFVNADMGTITRRTAGGRTLAFMPGREQIHIFYQSGQSRTPDNVAFAARECVRIAWEWTRQVGRGSQAPADAMEMGPALTAELSRVIRTFLAPTRRFPAIA